MLKKGDRVRLTRDYEIVISPVEMCVDVFDTIPEGTIVLVYEDQKEGDWEVYCDFTEALKAVEGVADNADPCAYVSMTECEPVDATEATCAGK